MPTLSLPSSLAELLAAFRPCFTAPTFTTFTALVSGFLAQQGPGTVTGMLVGARLSHRWHHTRAHRFFSAARWSTDQVGLALLEVIVRLLAAPDAPILLAVDDSLFKRAGRKVFGAAWHHDAAAPGRNRVAWGNSWVVVGVLVRLPFVPHRLVCLPVLARLWQPTKTKTTKGSKTRQAKASKDRPAKLTLARQLVEQVCARHPDRQVHLVGDAAYIGRTWRNPPATLTVTSRLRCDAALYQLAPPPTGKPGRPRVKGKRLPELIVLAGMTTTRFKPARVCCYGQQRTLDLAVFCCLWYGALGAQPVQVVLARPPGRPDGYELAVVSTDLAATPAELVERYSHRWGVETCFEEARQVMGVGQARNRTRRAVERTVPFGLVCMSLVVCWYALHGQPAADVAARRARAPWYRTKHTPSLADMLSALRRELLTAQFLPSCLLTPSVEETLQAQVVWAAAAA